jgi:hypothetical protein
MLEYYKVKNEKRSEKAECNLEGNYSPVWKIKNRRLDKYFVQNC